jgi:hypothetical protein
MPVSFSPSISSALYADKKAASLLPSHTLPPSFRLFPMDAQWVLNGCSNGAQWIVNWCFIQYRLNQIIRISPDLVPQYAF